MWKFIENMPATRYKLGRIIRSSLAKGRKRWERKKKTCEHKMVASGNPLANVNSFQ